MQTKLYQKSDKLNNTICLIELIRYERHPKSIPLFYTNMVWYTQSCFICVLIGLWNNKWKNQVCIIRLKKQERQSHKNEEECCKEGLTTRINVVEDQLKWWPRDHGLPLAEPCWWSEGSGGQTTMVEEWM